MSERAGEPFGVLLRGLREGAGLTQEELAERAALTVHAVSALERGVRTRPYPHTVRSLATALEATEEQRSALLAAVPPRASAPRGQTLPVRTPAQGKPLRASARSLPIPATPLVGRDEDVDRLVDLVPTSRLVTLTGTGGVGKTRLSLAVADAVGSSYPDGVTFVPLSAVSDADLVPTAIGRALGVDAEGVDAEEVLREHLRGLRVLLVLDNFEHVLDAAAAVARLLAASPLVTVLVTSRAPLQVRGELEVAVSPLAPPAAQELFLGRAQAVSPTFAVTQASSAAVAGICRRLSGIPLAVELAAAKVRVLDPGALLARLDEAMATGGARDLPERQRTMRATLDWSYSLLREPEQRLFRLLSTFAGGFTLIDVEQVAARLADGFPTQAGVLAGLESLVAQSLVLVDDGRYHLLEPVAQYAATLADEVGESQVLGRAHADHFLELAVEAAEGYEHADQVAWLARIEAEEPNTTAAFEWYLAHDPDRAGRLAWALWLYWWLRGRLRLGRRLADAALQHDLSPWVRVRTALTSAAMSFAMGDLVTSGRGWTTALRVAEEHDDVAGRAHGSAGSGLVALASGALEDAETWFRTAVPLQEAVGREGEWVLGLTHVWLGTVRLVSGDPDAAVEHIERGLTLARRRGDRLATYIGLFNLSQASIARGDHDRAREHLEEGITLSHETRDLANLAYFLEALAVVEDGAGGEPDRVAVLLGAAAAQRDAVGSNVYGYYLPDEALRESAEKGAREALGAQLYEESFARGAHLALADVVRFAVRPT